MDRDRIIKVEIDSLGCLHISPNMKKFTLVYRTAKQVHWNQEKQTVYSPKPTDWTYVDWYNHILKVVKEECFCELYLTDDTNWINVSEHIKSEITKV
ncbi:hypothetical protein [Ulvibacterium marinum]|nr:hypothetical protein [Ulvibacterium marinum]